ncbi:PREDICTED: uncharacterized protein LOC104721688 isoform X2 [Camelina sativa]|uniref:Uncharacterized protein LOC104721688 isoform X2 n=1 Tax=Camelina sativa TaxID=90675 RepID=A0ABM0U9S7_CAMSA|nr:PREDICTED: uncharacterized protein LOC104721688 isoform X2 [Camelina sativa]
MEVLVGSTFRDRRNDTAHDQGVQAGMSSRIGLRRCDITPSESWSSSVGESSENEEEQDDEVSSARGRWRGLSNHYIGKSKSFGNLMEAESNAKGLEKVESPLNKKRRLLIANKLRRRRSSSLSSSFSIYSNKNPNSMPLLALQESDLEDIHKYKDDNDDDSSDDDETSKLKEKRMKMTNTNNNTRDFMVHHTKRCFSLTSFQHDHR